MAQVLHAQVLESVLQTALDGEALFTIVAGAPAVSWFRWSPPQALLDQFALTDKDDGRPGGRNARIEELLEQALLRQRFCFCFPASEHRRARDEVPLCVIMPNRSTFWAMEERMGRGSFRRDRRQETREFELVCINIEALQRAGVGVAPRDLDYLLRFPTLFDDVCWTDWQRRADLVMHANPPLDPESPFGHVIDAFSASDDQLPQRSVHDDKPAIPPRDLQRFSFLQHPSYREEPSPLCVLHPERMTYTPEGRYAFLSTSTYTGVAPTGWRRTDLTRPLTAGEISCVQDRWAVLRVYRALRELYQGRMLSLMEDWSHEPERNHHYSMAHALDKARVACRMLPSGEALSEMLAAEAGYSEFAPKLQRLLRGWRVGPAIYAADYLRAASSEWEAERFRWGVRLSRLTLPELYQFDDASLPPGISRVKMVLTAQRLEANRLRISLVYLKSLIELPYLGLGFDNPDTQAWFLQPFTQSTHESTGSSSHSDDDEDEDDDIDYNARIQLITVINQELWSQYEAISEEERPKALVSRLWELSRPQMRGCDSNELAVSAQLALSRWPTRGHD